VHLGTMRRVGRPPIGSAARRLIAIRLNPEVLKRFRSKAKRLKVGYQTLIHRVLAEYVGAHATRVCTVGSTRVHVVCRATRSS